MPKKPDVSRAFSDCEFAFVQGDERGGVLRFGVLFGVKNAKYRRVIRKYPHLVVWYHEDFRRFYE